MLSQTSWTQQKQNKLKELIERQDNIRWNQISKKLNAHYNQNQYTAKQCRERYINYVKFGTKKEQLLVWSVEEEKLLFEFYEQLGSQWNFISQYLPNKSENCLKNKFYGTVRKLLRKLNSVGKLTKRIKKNLKYDSLIKPLEATAENVDLNSGLSVWAQGLRIKLIKFLKSNIQEIPNHLCLQLIEQINKFNLQTRSFSFRKRHPYKKNKSQSSEYNNTSSHNNKPVYSEQQNNEIKLEEEQSPDNKNNLTNSNLESCNLLIMMDDDQQQKQKQKQKQKIREEMENQELGRQQLLGREDLGLEFLLAEEDGKQYCCNGMLPELKDYFLEDIYNEEKDQLSNFY